MSNYTCARCGAHPIHLIEPCERHGDQGASSMTTDHPTDPPEYAPGGYVPAPGAEPCPHGPHLLSGNTCACGVRWTDEQIRDAVDRPGGEYPGQPIEEHPAPDLARDDDAQSEVGDEALAERMAEAMCTAHARRYNPTGDFWDAPEEYIGYLADAALPVVQPELDRHIGAHRRDNQRHANTAKVLRSELADLTAQRDAYKEAYAKQSNTLHGSQAKASRVDELTEAVNAAIRRAEAAEAELRRWQSVCGTSYEQMANMRTERDTAQAEVKELRERLDEARAACRGLTAALERTVADSVPAQPAYDGSCGASHFGKCGPKNLDCLRRETPLPADDSSEAEDLACSPCRAGDYKHWEHEPAWRPSPGEPVIRLGGAHEFPATVAEQRPDGTYLTHDQADGAEPVVTVEKLRPAGGVAMRSDLTGVELTRGTRLRNPLGAEHRITGLAWPSQCLGIVYSIESDDVFSPMRFATRDGLEEAGYEVVTDA